jgi:hypothetical protein
MSASNTTALELEQRLQAALVERDRALAALAEAREQLNAFRLALRNVGESSVPAYPVSAGLGPPPLRYLLVDRVNEQLKTVSGPIHHLLKALVDRKSR